MHLKTFQRRQIKQSTPQSGLKPPRPFTMQSPALEIGAANHRDAHAGSALKDHRSSLPDKIKAGIERLSGISLEDVQVHYNSARPAQFRALACTQGTQIHIGPGQERYLAHEAWHVVQQKQGRVKSKAREQRAGINEDSTLEREADALVLHALLGTVSSQRTV